tara:strand:- start:47 stop:769 length:723 start_codon:yes stop_codon:yes gene_type:complete
MKDRDQHLIYEAYIKEDIDTDKPIVGGRQGGLIGILANRVNNILRDGISDEEKLQQCNQVRDEAINIILVGGNISSNVSKEELIELICSNWGSGDRDWAQDERIWKGLSRINPDQVANIDILTLLSHVLGYTIETREDDLCRDAKSVMKYGGFILMPILKGVMWAIRKQVLTPMVSGMKTLNSLQDYSQIDTKVLEFISIGNRFERSMKGFWEKLEQLVRTNKPTPALPAPDEDRPAIEA